MQQRRGRAGRLAVIGVIVGSLLVPGLTGCSDDAVDKVAEQLPGDDSVGDKVAEQKDSRAFLEAAANSDLLESISQLKDATIFLPDADALDKLRSERPELFGSNDLSGVLAKYFTVPQRLDRDALAKSTKLTNLAGLPLEVGRADDKVTIAGAVVDGDPVGARNGFVYRLRGPVTVPSFDGGAEQGAGHG